MKLTELNWENCYIDINGIQLFGVTSIEYETPNPAEYSRGARGEILDVYRTNQKENTVSLTVKQSVISALEDSLGGGRPATDARFNVTVSYLQGNGIRTDSIIDFMVSGAPKAIGNDTAIMEIAMSGIAQKIIYNA